MIGRYPHRVILQRRERVSDGGGGFNVTWVRYGASRARVAPISSTEVVFAQQIQDETTHNVTLPYRSDIKAADRLAFRGRVFEITQVLNNNERGRYLGLRCSENVGTAQEEGGS